MINEFQLNGTSKEGVPLLPSQDAVINFYEGKPGGLSEVILSTLGRAVIVSPGLYLAGNRGTQLVKSSLAAALAIETFVLGWTYFRKRDQ